MCRSTLVRDVTEYSTQTSLTLFKTCQIVSPEDDMLHYIPISITSMAATLEKCNQCGTLKTLSQTLQSIYAHLLSHNFKKII